MHPDDGASGRREVTRALCWLPPRAAEHSGYSESGGTWSRSEETRRLIGRIGYRVTVETFQVADALRDAAPSLPGRRASRRRKPREADPTFEEATARSGEGEA